MGDQYPPGREELRSIGCETVDYPAGSVLWRIHTTMSTHVTPWNRLRTFGPLKTSRWEPHPLPKGEHDPLGAAYLGEDVTTCLAEVFQTSRFVDVDTASPYITAFRTAADLVLADLTGPWFHRAGASSAAALGAKIRTRTWARAIHEAWPDLDGIIAPSAVVGGRRIVAAWNTRIFPAAPESSLPLNSPAIVSRILVAANGIGYDSNIII
ncbi:RES family NAD+ phosphorylase [Arthrobacter sp. H14]|uniref:RES family NAD+ phosphorylase n=1 Tax=Arthrobacter sp. H14 TaxID=1312959 RepID=UPI0004AF93E2|nr:RES family NAD+ phosphorylase [Arthrobacter sp. H14]